MSVRRSGDAVARRIAVYVGLVGLGAGPRPRLARVLAGAEDSSRAEVGTSLGFAVVMFALVVPRLFYGSAWFRPIAGLAALILLANVVRLLRMLQRRRDSRPGSSLP